MLNRLMVALVVLAPLASIDAQWTPLTTGTRASLRGLSVVDARTVWASGTNGTVILTTDGGATWSVHTVPGAEKVDVRALHARSARVAHVASTTGVIWRTTDGGKSWSVRYQPTDTTTFVDAIDFWDDRHGIALGDPMGGRYLILLTDDAGETWKEAPAAGRPAANQGEAAFAASGSSLIVDGTSTVWLGTGGMSSRLHVSRDRSQSWSVVTSPMRQGERSQGFFSLTRSSAEILGVGGDYRVDTAQAGNVSRYDPAAKAWAPASAQPPRGYRSGVATFQRMAVAVGPSGSDISRDGGATWSAFDATGFHAVRATRDGTFFASGSDGRVGVYHATAPR
jgi:photosystem II stability/assembly factor-like uncharacterized protein